MGMALQTMWAALQTNVALGGLADGHWGKDKLGQPGTGCQWCIPGSRFLARIMPVHLHRLDSPGRTWG